MSTDAYVSSNETLNTLASGIPLNYKPQPANENESNRIKSLRQKHLMYKDLLKEAQSKPSTTDDYIQKLKKEKLQVKDTIERMTSAS